MSIGLLVFTLKDISIHSLLREINLINRNYLFISFLVFFVSIFFKAWRWQIITRLDKLYLYDFSIYFLLAHIIPYNTGEFVKVSLFSKHRKNYSEVLGNTFLERIYDILSFLIIIIIALLFFKNNLLIKYLIKLSLTIIIFLVLYIIFYKFFNKKNISFSLLTQFHNGFLLKKIHVSTHYKILGLTILLRVLSIVSIIFCLFAFNLQLSKIMLIAGSLVIYVVTSFSFFIPSSFGGLGIIQSSSLFSFWLIFNNLLQQKELYRINYQKILLIGHALWITPIICITFLVVFLSTFNLYKELLKINNNHH